MKGVVLSVLKGVVLSVLLVSSAVLYSSFLIIPAIVVLFVSLKTSKVLVERLVMEPWFGLVAAMLELLFRVKVVITGDVSKKLSSSHPTLIIMNHRCRFDWLFLWSYILRLGSLPNEKITLKSGLSKIPFIGCAMDLAMFIFLHRNWTEDKANITQMLQYYRDTSFPVQLLIFPEGTNISPSNCAKNTEYAKKNGLEVTEYVLHPRVKGFVHCVKALRSGRSQLDICDITVGYVGRIMVGEEDVVKGNIPSEVHFDVNLIPHKDIADLSDEELEVWLKEKWQRKENHLREFYQNHRFDSSHVYKDSWTVSIKLLWFLVYGILAYTVFLYYLPWTLVITLVFGAVSYGVTKTKRGWSRLILEWTEKKLT